MPVPDVAVPSARCLYQSGLVTVDHSEHRQRTVSLVMGHAEPIQDRIRPVQCQFAQPQTMNDCSQQSYTLTRLADDRILPLHAADGRWHSVYAVSHLDKRYGDESLCETINHTV